MDSIIYIGIDVHKDSYSYCSYLKDKDTFFAEHKSEADSKNAVKYIKSVIKTAGSQEPVLVGYEAGPTGYKLCRDLQEQRGQTPRLLVSHLLTALLVAKIFWVSSS